MMRRKIFEIVEHDTEGQFLSKLYDWLMLITIVISIVPLAFREKNTVFTYFETVSVVIFIADYLLRWITADYKLKRDKKWKSFLLYPFTFFAIIDLLSILPSVGVFKPSFRLLRITRLIKILRILKIVRYSHRIELLFNVLRKERATLLSVFMIAVFYIIVTALIMFNAEGALSGENAHFQNFFDALYWATTTLTTVGYGDIYPTTNIGRFISMLSAILGVAIIALPSGVITASYLEELKNDKKH
ncbi:MAG: ion transporter [Salinivirgaceae bacterium]|nr:ion transporter [Salinivirgaceae bacterium]